LFALFGFNVVVCYVSSNVKVAKQCKVLPARGGGFCFKKAIGAFTDYFLCLVGYIRC